MNSSILNPVPASSSQEQRAAIPTFSGSSSRRQQFTDDEVKPLLSNLSPASTLEALVDTSAVFTTRDRSCSFVEASVSNASESERAWGIKAALAGKKIREWHDELQGWPWHSGKGNFKNAFHDYRDNDTLVQQFQERIETIRDDMETLEVEELKDRVREVHVKRWTFHPEISNYDQLDDFTAIITATIVQSLPTLSRLEVLLNVWSTRLIIIRQLPTFFREVTTCQESMLSAWRAIGQGDNLDIAPKPDFSRKASSDIKAVLQDHITKVGSRVDGMLNLLEGGPDTLPEQWIDVIDKLEDEYSTWVVRAEELVLNNEMESALRTQPNLDQKGNESNNNKIPLPLGKQAASTEEKCDERLASSVDGVSDGSSSTPQAPTLAISDDEANMRGQEGSILGGHASNFLQTTDTSSVPGQDRSLGFDISVPSTSVWTSKEAVSRKPQCLSVEIPPPDFESAVSASDAESNSHQSGSTTSSYLSNRSSPEIMNASVVTYLGTPVKVSSPTRSDCGLITDKESRPLSQPIKQDSSELTEAFLQYGIKSPIGRRHRAMTSPPGAPIPQNLSAAAGEQYVPKLDYGHTRVSSASLKSFEKIPTGNVRKLFVRRSGSYSPAPRNDGHAKLLDYSMQTVSSLLPADPDPPASGLRISPSCRKSSAKRFHKEISPSSTKAQSAHHSPSSPTRPYSRFENIIDSEAGTTHITVRKQRPPLPASKTTSSTAPGKVRPKPRDKLEARISSILDHIPADIRLKTSGAATPPPPSPTRQRNLSNPKTPLRRSITTNLLSFKRPTYSPSLTLAPAPATTDAKPSTTTATNEPEIKVYHLHQDGKDSAPVKLYVRLVGETGERVMVRVGGGWADLGEYLREYALHHGKRSVSDARLNIQNIPTSTTPAGSRPGTPISGPSTGSGGRRSRTDDAAPTHQSPILPPSSSSSLSSSPSRPSSRSSRMGEEHDSPAPSLGLAGPKTRRVDISPSKQAWVDDMLEQARVGSGEKSKSTEKKKKKMKGKKVESGGLGFLGKVGGSRRVFLKGEVS